ncbi:MAG: recombination protein RecR [Chloroflexi bacterium]|nr:recombination protein RecR [Chloroflexota bacterium]
MSSAVPQSVTRLVDEFSRLPGIGPKTAARLTYYLLRTSSEQSLALAAALTELVENTRTCSVCCNITESDPCSVCTDDRRNRRVICVVEEPLDVIAIERTATYQGLYHVLHGAINPMEGIGPTELKIEELAQRVGAGHPTEEIIVATNVSLEGDATASYIRQRIKTVSDKVRVTRLARGLPVGGDLEYADTITLLGALEGRREMLD